MGCSSILCVLGLYARTLSPVCSVPMGFFPSLVVTGVLGRKLHAPLLAFPTAAPMPATPLAREKALNAASPISAAPIATAVPAPAMPPIPKPAAATGPTAPTAAPTSAPAVAAPATAPQSIGFPLLACCATETTVPTTAPITAPRIAVHQGQQCPVGSLRVSGLSPT